MVVKAIANDLQCIICALWLVHGDVLIVEKTIRVEKYDLRVKVISLNSLVFIYSDSTF